jgi:integrase/recombinase XerD
VIQIPKRLIQMPKSLIQMLRNAHTPRKLLTLVEIRRVDESLHGTRHQHRDRALLLLQLSTGLRVSELASLNVADVLHDGALRRQFRVERARRRHGQPRIVYLENEKTRRALYAYLRHRRTRLDFDDTEPLFIGQKPDANGELRLRAKTVAHLFAKLYRDAGVVGASADSGRRWFIAQLARAGIRDDIIQKRAGHAHVSTTRRYLDADSADERRAVREVEL